MHPAATRNEFLRLRVQGLSLACIGRRLGVSKPTLIAWNRQSRVEIASLVQADRQRVAQEVSTSAVDELAALNRRLAALKQELFSRAMREFPTSALEILAGEIRQRIEKLTGACPPALSSLGGGGSPGTATPESLLVTSHGAQASACSNSVPPPDPAMQSSSATACPPSDGPCPS